MTTTQPSAALAEEGSQQASTPARSSKGAWWTSVADMQRALVLLDDDRALKGAEWAVLSIIQSRVSDGTLRDARVYREWIAETTGLSIPSVDRALRRLRENGWVIRVSEGGTRKVDGQTRNLPSVYDLGVGPKIDPATSDETVVEGGVPLTCDRGVAITHDSDPLSQVIDLVVPKSCPPPVDPRASAATAAAAPEARNSKGKSSTKKNEPRRRDTTAIQDHDAWEQWIEDEWGVSFDAADWESREVFNTAESMWQQGCNWKAIANMIEKRTGYPHDGRIPPFPSECIEGCNRGMIDAARDRRTHAVRPLRGERHATWEDHCIVPCPACRPGDYADRVQSWDAPPEPTPDEVAAIIARSPLATVSSGPEDYLPPAGWGIGA